MTNKEVTPALIKELRDRTGVGMAKCKEALDNANGDIEAAIAHLRKSGMASAVKKESRETKEGVIKVKENDKALAIVEVNAETDFVVKNDKFQAFADEIAEEVLKTSPANLEDFLAQRYSKDSNITIDEHRAITVQSLGENIRIRRVDIFPKKSKKTIGFYSHMGGKLVTLVEIDGSDAEQELAKDISMHIAAESPEFLSPSEVPARVVEHEKEIARGQVQNKPEAIVEKIVDGKLKAYYAQACLLNQNFVKDPSMTVEQLVEKRGKEKGVALKLTQFLRWKAGE